MPHKLLRQRKMDQSNESSKSSKVIQQPVSLDLTGIARKVAEETMKMGLAMTNDPNVWATKIQESLHQVQSSYELSLARNSKAMDHTMGTIAEILEKLENNPLYEQVALSARAFPKGAHSFFSFFFAFRTAAGGRPNCPRIGYPPTAVCHPPTAGLVLTDASFFLGEGVRGPARRTSSHFGSPSCAGSGILCHCHTPCHAQCHAVWYQHRTRPCATPCAPARTTPLPLLVPLRHPVHAVCHTPCHNPCHMCSPCTCHTVC